MRLVLVGFVAVVVLGGRNAKADFIWTQKADMPTPRWMHTSAAVNGKIYIIGGVASEPANWQNESGEILSTVEEYNPATDTWTKKADMPTARGWLPPSSPVVHGKIYVIGGGGIDDVNWGSSTVEVYDPATDTWTRKADMPTPRWCLATCAVNGKIYAIGGAPNSYRGLSVVEEYDRSTDAWTRKANMPIGVWGLCTSVVDGKVYAIGGATNIVAGRFVQEYDPSTDIWTRKADMPTIGRNFSTSVLCGKICAIGGWRASGSTPYSAMEVYDPWADSWTLKADLPALRAGLSTCTVDDRIYAIGGTDRPHPCPATSTVYEFGPILDFNGDGRVDGREVLALADRWGADASLCDIGPTPWGDGIVDVQDLIVLAEYIGKEVDDPTLAAHWALDEAEGIIASDSAGSHDGTVMGTPAWRADGGQVDGALEFNGMTFVTADAVLSPTDGPFSVFAWVKGGAPGQVIVSQTTGKDWLLADSLNGSLATEIKQAARAGQPLYSEAVITDGNWHRVGFAWDGSAGRLYVDDVLVAEDTQTKLADCTGGLNIGGGANLAAGSFWEGLIDDVRIYNRAVRP